MEPSNRKKEIVDVCLQTFMKNGLTHTSTRDLCAALNLNSGGVFYYFKTKDEIVEACAEEASLRIERDLMEAALNDIENPTKMMTDLRDRADAMRPLMKFFVSVSTCAKYTDMLTPLLERLTTRYDYYCLTFASVLDCSVEEISPYVYTGINALLSYMLFSEKKFSAPQLRLIHNALTAFLNRRDNKKLNKDS